MILSAAQKKKAIRIATESLQNVIDQLSEAKEDMAVQLVEGLEYFFNNSSPEGLHTEEGQEAMASDVYDASPIGSLVTDSYADTLSYFYKAFGVKEFNVEEEEEEEEKKPLYNCPLSQWLADNGWKETGGIALWTHPTQWQTIWIDTNTGMAQVYPIRLHKGAFNNSLDDFLTILADVKELSEYLNKVR